MNRAVIWIKNDLRLEHNGCLTRASELDLEIIPVYIFDEEIWEEYGSKEAQKVWLHYSLDHLYKEYHKHHIDLIIKKGSVEQELEKVIKQVKASHLFFHRGYEPKQMKREKKIKQTFETAGIDVQDFPSYLLFEPWEIETKEGKNYSVFTPFSKACMKSLQKPKIFSCPRLKPCMQNITSDSLETLNLLPSKPNWSKNFFPLWEPGEKGAHKRLKEFLKTKLNNYSKGRDEPGLDTTSRLSPHLHFGEITPAQIVDELEAFMDKKDASKFLSELIWREFSYHLLYYFPDLPKKPFQEKFKNFKWDNNEQYFHKWQKGQTGFPIVDAGMRELWSTGWMHNRVRMIVASFLIKDLLIHWEKGAMWFLDTLLDADIANNFASWQWVAGCGADAAPYFRIFNPILQAKKFDPNGEYIKIWVPELRDLPTKYIHAPSEAPEVTLREAGITLGESYPLPIVDHAKQREEALKRLDAIKK